MHWVSPHGVGVPGEVPSAVGVPIGVSSAVGVPIGVSRARCPERGAVRWASPMRCPQCGAPNGVPRAVVAPEWVPTQWGVFEKSSPRIGTRR